MAKKIKKDSSNNNSNMHIRNDSALISGDTRTHTYISDNNRVIPTYNTSIGSVISTSSHTPSSIGTYHYNPASEMLLADEDGDAWSLKISRDGTLKVKPLNESKKTKLKVKILLDF